MYRNSRANACRSEGNLKKLEESCADLGMRLKDVKVHRACFVRKVSEDVFWNLNL